MNDSIFFNEPPAHFARSTDADGRRTFAPVTPEKQATRFTGQACGGKNSNRCMNRIRSSA